MGVFDERHWCDQCGQYKECNLSIKGEFAPACDEFEYSEEMWEQHYEELEHYPFNEPWYISLVERGLQPDENGRYHKNRSRQFELPKNAWDARNRTTSVCKDITVEREVQNCEKEVLKAIQCHQFSAYVDWISDAAKSILERKGYIFTKGDEKAYYSGYTIHWDHPKNTYESSFGKLNRFLHDYDD